MEGIDEIVQAGRDVVKGFSKLSAFLELLAEEIDDALLCEASDTGFFLWLSPNWTKFLGWTNEELLAVPWLEFVHPDDQAATITAAAAMKQQHIINFMNRYRCKDGTWIKLRWRAQKFNGVAWCVARPLAKMESTG